MADLSTLETDAIAALNALAVVIDIAAPAAAPTVALVSRLIAGAVAGQASAAALIAQIKAGTAITAEQVKAADDVLDAAFADLDAAEKEAGGSQ